MNLKKLPDTLLVSIDFGSNANESVLLVGRKHPNQAVDIVNAFKGKEAIDIYDKLVTPKIG